MGKSGSCDLRVTEWQSQNPSAGGALDYLFHADPGLPRSVTHTGILGSPSGLPLLSTLEETWLLVSPLVPPSSPALEPTVSAPEPTVSAPQTYRELTGTKHLKYKGVQGTGLCTGSVYSRGKTDTDTQTRIPEHQSNCRRLHRVQKAVGAKKPAEEPATLPAQPQRPLRINTHAHVNTHVQSRMHTRTHVHTCVHACTRAATHTCSRICTHAHVRSRHTCTRMYFYSPPSVPFLMFILLLPRNLQVAC